MARPSCAHAALYILLCIVLKGAIHQADARITVKYTCQGNVMNLHCQSPRAIKIYRARYIREQDNICYRGHSANYCDPVDKMSLVRKHCEGQMTCNISVDRNTMGDKCPRGFLYLKVMYNCKTFPRTTEPPYVRNKSSMVLTRPSTLHQFPNESTGDPNKEMVYHQSPTKGIEKEEESTSVVCGIVLYNGESVYTISSVLATLILALKIFM